MRDRSNPLESVCQRRVKAALAKHGWHIEVLSCNAFQKGIPDLYAFKADPGGEHHRWIDVKRPKGSTLTKHQCQKWPVWEAIGLGVWILTGSEANPEDILFGPPNFRNWWKPRYDKFLIRPGSAILMDEFPDAEICT